MKLICILFSVGLIAFSCSGRKNGQSYISSYIIKDDGQMGRPNFSLIEIRSDSVFYRDLYDVQNVNFLGKKLGHKKSFKLGELSFKFMDDELEVSNGQFKSVYKLLGPEQAPLDIDASFFVGHGFVIKSGTTKDTIFFNDNDSYKSISENHSNRWRLMDAGNYKLLWMFYGLDEVPLIIESFNDNKVIAYLYALKKEKISLEKLP